MRFFFTALSYLLFGIAFPFLALHPKLRKGLGRRFGFYGTPRHGAGRPTVWMHGASAGDIGALHPTALALRKLRPDCFLVLSTVTDSGSIMAKKLSSTFDFVTFQPYDLPGPVRRTFDALRPDVVVLEYTELWPQLIYEARRRQIPVVLHNGRFSPGSMLRYKTLFKLMGNLLTPLAALLVRDEHEAERARELGARPEQVEVTGNTKFDNIPRTPDHDKTLELREAFGLDDQEPVWVAGSTHEGEEEDLLRVFKTLRQEFPTLRMVIVPRYLERIDRIAGMVKREGLSVGLRSSGEGPADVGLLDSVGELSACYALGTVVFVGGSFVARGGQNILEPAGCGRPVIFGPNMRNFADSVKVLLGRGGLQAATTDQLLEIIQELLRRPDYCEELGQLAHAQVLQVQGAALRNATRINEYLPAVES